jgi:hypothetical protein
VQLFYEGTEITDFVDVTACEHRDVAGGRADGLMVTMEHAEKWYAWGPKKGDKMLAARDGYDTGVLYVDMILPENGKFTITATSMPAAALRKAWKTYEQTTIGGILKACAAECGMNWAAHGVDTEAAVPFLLRRNEGCAALLQRLLARECATLKCLNGTLTAIGIPYAQTLETAITLELDARTPGFAYRRIDQRRLAAVNVVSLYGAGRATDSNATDGLERTYANLPAMSAVDAAKWARGMLMIQNRTAEETELQTTFNPHMSALMRVDITGPTDATGEWLVEEARHDLYNGKTTAKLYRCLTSIA